MAINLSFTNRKIESTTSIRDMINQYKSIRFGLKRYIWSEIDRSALLKENKANGVFKDYLIARGKRKEDGFYSQDEVDWNRYNKDMWANYAREFDKNVIGHEVLKTAKEISEAKTEILKYFIEEYGHKVNLKVHCTKLSVLNTDEGITISHKEGIFTIQSPSKTLSIVIDKKGILQIVNHTKNIMFPPKAVSTLQEMLRIGELISLNPSEAIKNPYEYLNIDKKVSQMMSSAQAFLIKVNQDYLDRQNAQKKAQSKEQQLTHENYSKKQVTVKISKKAETIDEIKSDGQAYPWKNFKIVKGNHYYGVRALAYLDWLTKEEISEKCHKFMIDNDGEIERVIDISHNEEITAIDSEYKNTLIQDKKDTTILWIPEEEFQVWRLNK